MEQEQASSEQKPEMTKEDMLKVLLKGLYDGKEIDSYIVAISSGGELKTRRSGDAIKLLGMVALCKKQLEASFNMKAE